MSYAVKNYKETEQRLHEMLYENLNMLTFFYTPRTEFNEVFKRDMFIKNNKAAFYEVVYYLLNILNAEMTKIKLTHWPPYDIKRETKFRTELLKYINELNSIYSNANIPQIMASHLISPGGYKIASFILKLTHLVIYQHLQTEGSIIYKPTPFKNESNMKVILQNIKTYTTNIKQETSKNIKNFNLFDVKTKNEAQEIIEQQKQVQENLQLSKQEYQTVRKDFDEKHPSFPSVEVLESKIKTLEKNIEKIASVCNKFKEIDELRQTLLSDERVLQHDPDDFKLPTEIQHIVNKGDVLDLQEYFNGLVILLRKKFLNLNIHTTLFLNNLGEQSTEANISLEKMSEKLTQHIEKIKNSIEITKITFSKKNEEPYVTAETLAVPLRDCSE